MQFVLGMGSNQGNPLQNLRRAIRLIKLRPNIRILKASPIYESDALLPEGSKPSWNMEFLNLNLLCMTDLEPLGLLEALKSIEKAMGRVDRGKWAPRVIDLDILAADALHYEQEGLIIPHPGLLERPFAALPLADVLPAWQIPVGPDKGKTISEAVAHWRHRSHSEVPFRTRRSHQVLTLKMGVLNVTPDSFSDGGQFLAPSSAVKAAKDLIQQGCDILDIGAESTRPGATPLQESEEWARLEPLLQYLAANKSHALISLDTRHSGVASRALELGVDWINDVSGCADPKMASVVAGSRAELVIMHHLGVPPLPDRRIPTNQDPVATVLEWGQARIEELEEKGISRERIWFDPGIGFGKTVEQNWEILRRASELHELGVRILIGHSRKSFLKGLTDPLTPAQRDLETALISGKLVSQGVECLRVHDIGILQRVLRLESQMLSATRYS